jgi:hypothetical protein
MKAGRRLAGRAVPWYVEDGVQEFPLLPGDVGRVPTAQGILRGGEELCQHQQV